MPKSLSICWVLWYIQESQWGLNQRWRCRENAGFCREMPGAAVGSLIWVCLNVGCQDLSSTGQSIMWEDDQLDGVWERMDPESIVVTEYLRESEVFHILCQKASWSHLLACCCPCTRWPGRAASPEWSDNSTALSSYASDFSGVSPPACAGCPGNAQLQVPVVKAGRPRPTLTFPGISLIPSNLTSEFIGPKTTGKHKMLLPSQYLDHGCFQSSFQRNSPPTPGLEAVEPLPCSWCW